MGFNLNHYLKNRTNTDFSRNYTKFEGMRGWDFPDVIPKNTKAFAHIESIERVAIDRSKFFGVAIYWLKETDFKLRFRFNEKISRFRINYFSSQRENEKNINLI